MVQTVLGGAQGAADVGDVVDGVLNGLQRIGSIGLVSDVQVSNTKRPGVTVIDSDIQLVVAGRGVADLQGQATLASACSKSQITCAISSASCQVDLSVCLHGKAGQPVSNLLFSICCVIFLCQRLRGIPDSLGNLIGGIGSSSTLGAQFNCDCTLVSDGYINLSRICIAISR